jgi:hypothetical protein
MDEDFSDLCGKVNNFSMNLFFASDSHGRSKMSYLRILIPFIVLLKGAPSQHSADVPSH